MGAGQMARNDEEEILALEMEASQIGYGVVERLSVGQSEPPFRPRFQDETGPIRIGELELLSNQFRWIAGHLGPKGTGVRSPAERKRVRQEISKRTKELSDVVREKHTQHHLAFSCIDLHDACVAKRKRQKKSTYVCFLALYICLGSSLKGLLAAIAAAAAAGRILG
jgi:hypothetical protein